jgi:hypothetical protein|tara:strand:- start:2471 stop:2599 length:129 start_codon:yes stop_codon:yes gene_type:complete
VGERKHETEGNVERKKKEKKQALSNEDLLQTDFAAKKFHHNI